jgi:hypothetical protein
MECLLAKIKTNQAKACANLKEMKEVTASLEAMIQTNQEKVMVKLYAYHKRMMARMDSQLGKMEACLEETEAMEEIRVRVGASGSP